MHRAVDHTPMAAGDRVEIRGIVGHQDDGAARNLRAFNHGADERYRGFVQAGRSLVEEYQLGFGQDESGDINAARHTVR